MVQAGGFMDQTPSMLNDRQGATTGAWILEMHKPSAYEAEHLPPKQILLSGQSFPYFNKEYYSKRRPERSNI